MDRLAEFFKKKKPARKLWLEQDLWAGPGKGFSVLESHRGTCGQSHSADFHKRLLGIDQEHTYSPGNESIWVAELPQCEFMAHGYQEGGHLF